MISIVMAYKDRRQQIIQTLDSIQSQGYSDMEVIAVDDFSVEAESIEDLTSVYDFLTVVKLTQKVYKNPCIAFNIGFSHAMGDVIIIQNPECMHVGNLIAKANEAITDDNYLSFGCYAITDKDLSEEFASLAQNNTTSKAEELIGAMPQHGVGLGGVGCWYNHSVYSPRHFHFTTAIARHNLADLCGFDERFAKGMDFDDDDLLMRVRRKGLRITPIDRPFSVHLWHPSPYSEFLVDGVPTSWQQMSAMNHTLFMASQGEAGWRADRNEYYNPYRD